MASPSPETQLPRRYLVMKPGIYCYVATVQFMTVEPHDRIGHRSITVTGLWPVPAKHTREAVVEMVIAIAIHEALRSVAPYGCPTRASSSSPSSRTEAHQLHPSASSKKLCVDDRGAFCFLEPFPSPSEGLLIVRIVLGLQANLQYSTRRSRSRRGGFYNLSSRRVPKHQGRALARRHRCSVASLGWEL